MARAQSSQPTVKKDLEGRVQLQPTIQRGVSTYDEARPGRVEYDRYAGQQWRYLGAVLADYEPSLRSLHKKAVDEKIMEDKNAGSLFFEENPERTANMEAWRRVGEQDEDVRNMSPYVRNWVTRSVLKNQAILFNAELKDAYVTSGMVNNTNAEEVQKWAREFHKNYMTKHGITTEGTQWDGIDIAENYSVPALQAVDSLLAKHNRDLEAQNSEKIAQGVYKDFDDLAMSWMLDPTGGLNPKFPNERAALVAKSADWLNTERERIKQLGFRESEILPMLADTVMKSHLPVSIKRHLAENMNVRVNGAEIAVITYPGIRKALEEAAEQESDKAWKLESRAHQRKVWAKQDAQDAALADGVLYVSENRGRDIDTSFEAYKARGGDAQTYASWKSSVESALEGQTKSPARFADFLQTKLDILNGRKGAGEIMEEIRQGLYSPSEAAILFDELKAASTGDMNRTQSNLKRVQSTVITTMIGCDQEEALALQRQYETTGRLPLKYQGMEQAFAMLPDIEREYMQELENVRNEVGGGKPLTTAENDRLTGVFLSRKIPELRKESAANIQQQKTQQQTIAENSQFRTWINGTEREFDIFGADAMVQRQLGFQMRNNFLQLYPSLPAEELPTDNDPLGLINYMYAHNGGTWQNIVRVVTGESPEDLGIRSMQEAREYLASYLPQYGYVTKKKPIDLQTMEAIPE